MRRITMWVCVLLGALVIYNVYTRESGPVIRPAILIPFLADHEVLAKGLAFLLQPGCYVLWYLGLPLATRLELIIAALLSWWAALIAIRIIRRVLFLQS